VTTKSTSHLNISVNILFPPLFNLGAISLGNSTINQLPFLYLIVPHVSVVFGAVVVIAKE